MMPVEIAMLTMTFGAFCGFAAGYFTHAKQHDPFEEL